MDSRDGSGNNRMYIYRFFSIDKYLITTIIKKNEIGLITKLKIQRNIHIFSFAVYWKNEDDDDEE